MRASYAKILTTRHRPQAINRPKPTQIASDQHFATDLDTKRFIRLAKVNDFGFGVGSRSWPQGAVRHLS